MAHVQLVGDVHKVHHIHWDATPELTTTLLVKLNASLARLVITVRVILQTTTALSVRLVTIVRMVQNRHTNTNAHVVTTGILQVCRYFIKIKWLRSSAYAL